ncbi:MAG: bifunctional diaminohydroxyphosphoribosylaminopyrimidine deaminase/5-amino-6-(5-phosphoribosylamino)uracil reductase RibD [Woeseiaceae bacterium]
MSAFSAAESAHMARAMQLAARGRYTAHPNPMVGCVLVHDDDIVGEGWHEVAGAAHAEVNALNAAGDRAAGATAFVTLEPCAHEGKTPPCAPALIDAGIAAAVVAMQDPFPAVGGKGIAALESAGISVRKGLMGDAAATLNQGFLSRVQRGRPYVRVKVGASLDGAIAMSSGESQWITGPEARADVQRLRARSGAVLTGIGTVLADDPSLNVRDEDLDTAGRQPLRAVLDSGLRMPLSAGMLALPGTTVVYCADDGNRQSLVDAGANVVKVGTENDFVDAAAVLADLARREINDVLVEAGPTITGELLSQHLVDELVIYQAPHIMGSETMTMFRTPGWQALSDRLTVEIADVRRVGRDIRVTVRLEE